MDCRLSASSPWRIRDPETTDEAQKLIEYKLFKSVEVVEMTASDLDRLALVPLVEHLALPKAILLEFRPCTARAEPVTQRNLIITQGSAVAGHPLGISSADRNKERVFRRSDDELTIGRPGRSKWTSIRRPNAAQPAIQ